MPNFAILTHNPGAVASKLATVLGTVGFLALTLVPETALAQSSGGFNVPFISEFGCQVVQWMKGPLAVLIFIIVIIATLVIGMITKMDWGRIITVAVIFGLIVAVGGILGNSQYIQNVAGLSACLQ
jgi:type IV secretory pathway VirB2 component (pilin)